MTIVQLPADQLEPASRDQVRKAAYAGLVGTMLENYDFVVYGTASALIFNKLFFPSISPIAGTIAAFSTYAVGFCARPVGGIFFSHFGEKHGRKWVLVTTLFLMGTATFAIGCLPTYNTLGIVAPLLLVLCRFLQGFGAGAEQSGGATLLTETAPLGKRGFYASFVQVGAALGSAVGALAWVVVQLLPEDAMMSWGWRLIFWFSIVVTIVAALVRARLNESPVFTDLKQTVDVEDRAPLAEVWHSGRGVVLRVIGIFFGASTHSYIYQVFMASYLVSVLAMDSTFVPRVLLIGAICAAAAAAVSGHISDKLGRRRWISILCVVLGLAPFMMFPLLHTRNPIIIACVIIFGFIFAAQGIVAPHMSYFPELFGNRFRYAGVTLGREFASVIGGGFAPLLATALLAWFSNSWIPVAIYMFVVMVVSLIATLVSPETLNRDLTVDHNAQPGEAVRQRADGQWETID